MFNIQHSTINVQRRQHPSTVSLHSIENCALNIDY